MFEGTYEVLEAATAETGFALFDANRIDLCLVDINLPHADGFRFCQQIRENSTVPIIFITVNDNEESLYHGLTCGGDDYVTKPFSFRELELRVMAQLRRSQYNHCRATNAVVCGAYTLNFDERTLFWHDKQIEITKTEFELLRRLMEHSGCLVTRERLLGEIWDIHENYVENNTLTVNISRLRKKLTNEHTMCPIETVPGIGYRWKA